MTFIIESSVTVELPVTATDVTILPAGSAYTGFNVTRRILRLKTAASNMRV